MYVLSVHFVLDRIHIPICEGCTAVVETPGRCEPSASWKQERVADSDSTKGSGQCACEVLVCEQGLAEVAVL